MEQMKEVCVAGDNIIVECSYFNQEVADLLESHSYFCLIASENAASVSKSMLFVHAIPAANKKELQQAWQARKNVVMSRQAWMDELAELGYVVAAGFKAIDPQGAVKGCIAELEYYLVDDDATLQEVVFPEQTDRMPEYVEDVHSTERWRPETEPEWQQALCFQIDSSKWNTKPIVPLPLELQSPKTTTQTIVIKVVVQPFIKVDNGNLRVKLNMQKLFVGINSRTLLPKGSCLGFFADFIKLSFTPNWAREKPSVPIFDPVMPICSGSLMKRSRDDEVSISVGVEKSKLGFKRNWHKEWEDTDYSDKVRVVEDDEDGSIAGFEWALLQWANGKSYLVPKQTWNISNLSNFTLPYEGTGRTLAHPELPDVVWVVPTEYDRMKDLELSLELNLEVNFTIIWSEKYAFFQKPKFKQTSFPYHEVIKIKLPVAK